MQSYFSRTWSLQCVHQLNFTRGCSCEETCFSAQKWYHISEVRMYLQSTLQSFPDKNNYRRYESGTSVHVIDVSLLMKGRAAGMLIIRECFKSFCVERAGRLGSEPCLTQHRPAPALPRGSAALLPPLCACCSWKYKRWGTIFILSSGNETLMPTLALSSNERCWKDLCKIICCLCSNIHGIGGDAAQNTWYDQHWSPRKSGLDTQRQNIHILFRNTSLNQH